jgi:hypothetical protein
MALQAFNDVEQKYAWYRQVEMIEKTLFEHSARDERRMATESSNVTLKTLINRIDKAPRY